MSMVTKLNVEIEEKFDKLAKLDPTTKEYSAAVDSVTKLMEPSRLRNSNRLRLRARNRWKRIVSLVW